MSIQRKATERVELVETHNLVLSLRRLRDIKPYDQQAWKRAVYHAVLMAYLPQSFVSKLREALELP